MTAALICARCGAPLPLEAAASPVARCAYCEATLVVHGAAVSVAGDAPPPPASAGPTPSQAFMMEVASAITAGGDPYAALCTASAKHLGVAGQSDAVAKVTLGIANEFDQANGTKIARDGAALSRVAEAYLKAIGQLARSSSARLDLQFIAATGKGPVHLQRTLDTATIAKLASGERPKKKGWF